MIVAYTYYSRPWAMTSGDEVRIHTILKGIAEQEGTVVAYVLSHRVRKETRTVRDGVNYYLIPRKFYSIISRLLRWKNNTELNPLIKLTHYIDELIAMIRISGNLRKAKFAYLAGSMTLASFFLKVLGIKLPFLYDPLANYAQTLYLRSRENVTGLLRYSIYLLLHKLQLESSDCIIYPAELDKENAARSFGLRPTIIIPNPFPICYEDSKEYEKYRKSKDDVPYFIFTAGGRGRANEDAVRLIINVFNELPPNSFRLIITGPWEDMYRLARNESIKLVGLVPHEEIKKVLAMGDYGLSPIFSHSAGTFIKILAYMAAGLDIISTPMGIYGLSFREHGTRLYLIRNADELRKVINKIVRNWGTLKHELSSRRHVVTCDQANELIRSSLRRAISSCLSIGYLHNL